jgi:hypothetical protein
MARGGTGSGREDGPAPLAGDGLPMLPTGEPVLARWFVLTMLLLVPAAIGVTVWALTAVDRAPLDAAARRPAGGPEVTVARGDAQLATDATAEDGPGCAEGIALVGDDGSRAAARRALGATCQLLASGDFPRASAGLEAWIAASGRLRLATFELSGVESSARVEDGAIVVELNARFAFEDATRAAPEIVHQLVHLAAPDWPGTVPSVAAASEAALEQDRACARLSLPGGLPRGCRDAAELLADPDAAARLAAAGYRPS